MRIENGFSLPIWASNSLDCPEQHLLQSFQYYGNLDGGPLLEFLKEQDNTRPPWTVARRGGHWALGWALRTRVGTGHWGGHWALGGH